MCFVGTAAAACDIEESGLRHLTQMTGRIAGQLVVLTHLVGQSGVGIERQEHRDAMRQLFDKRSEVCHPKRAVQSEAQQVWVVTDTDIECLEGLSCQRPSAAVVDGRRYHYRYLSVGLVVETLDGIECRLGVQRVETGLHQQQVGSSFHECLCLFVVGVGHLVEGGLPIGWLTHIRGQRQRPGRGSHRSCHVDLLSAV